MSAITHLYYTPVRFAVTVLYDIILSEVSSCCLDDLCRAHDGVSDVVALEVRTCCCVADKRNEPAEYDRDPAWFEERRGGLLSIFRLIPNSTRAILAGDLWCGQ